MSRDAIVSRWVIRDRLLSPSMATNTLATGSPTRCEGQQLNSYAQRLGG
ncbi:MAG: hypothetical protein K0A94_08765 [Desulfuromonadales bacterium]|nr:hypothetical protein [Desulfuromonadales bacterium]